jgi:multidrug resistance efflux pump
MKRGFLTRRSSAVALAVCALMIGVSSYVLAGRDAVDEPDPAIVATGTIEADEIAVSTKIMARVTGVRISEGEGVSAGAVMFHMDVSELEAQRQQAVALLHDAEAQLALLTAGARAEDVAAARAAMAEAEQNLQRYLNGSRPEEVLQAGGNLRVAQAVQEQAAREYERLRMLHESGDVPRARLQSAESELDAANGRLEAAKQQLAMVGAGPRWEDTAAAKERLHQLQAAYQRVLAGPRAEEIAAARWQVEQSRATVKLLEVQLAEAHITAPVAGTITSVVTKPGEVVRPGQTLATLVSTKSYWVDVFIDETLAGRLAVDQPAELTLPAFPGRRFVGRVSSINESRVGERQTKDSMNLRSLRVRVEVERGEALMRPGMSVEVAVFTGRAS